MRIVLAAGAMLAVWLGWRWLVDHGPLTELDDLYPPPRDAYLDDLLGSLTGWAT